MKEARIWAQISQNLNSATAVKFKVNQTAVRERCDLLIGIFRQQSREEAKASGVSPEQTELEALLEEISEREKLAESTRESSSSKNVESDRKNAREIRTQVLERVCKTKKRQMKIVKDNLKGSVEAELMLQNFYEKRQKRSSNRGARIERKRN